LGATTIWAQGTNVLGAVQGIMPQSQSEQQAQNRCQAYEQALAHQLGIDVGKLQQAQKDAAKAVVDQALKDGQLTQAQADAAKQKINQANFEQCPRIGALNGKAGKVEGAMLTTAVDAAAHALNMTPQQLKDAVKSGQSIEDIAKSKSVDLQTVKAAVITAEKAAIDQALKDGKITQVQADKLKNALEQNADKLFNMFKQHRQTK
jgi:hypothetical protein